jgi:hypothetical protein
MKDLKKLHVAMLLDESGSMGMVKEEVINGYNKYIDSVERVRFTLTKFDSSKVKIIHDAVPIKKVPHLTDKTYVPGAMTPLLDAMGTTIKAMGKKKKVLFIIFTDGYENASQKWCKRDIEKLIKKRTERGWQFMFLGADMAGIKDAADVGIPVTSTHRYKPGTEVAELTSAALHTVSWVESGASKAINLEEDAE